MANNLIISYELTDYIIDTINGELDKQSKLRNIKIKSQNKDKYSQILQSEKDSLLCTM